jgi:hypothetical protein
MSNSDRIACESKSGQVDPIKDEKGCIKEYKCYTQEQLVEQMIERTQRPGCPINNNVKNKLLECRKNNKPNFSSTYDNNGCTIDITNCR